MFKKLSASVFALVLVAGVFAPAQAQDTIALYFDNAGTLERVGNTGALPFTIVVGHDTVNPSSAAEFIMTEIVDQLAGIFKIGTVKINNTPLDLGDNSVGEYLISFAGCVGAGFQELVRVQYVDSGGAVGADRVLTLRGFGPGDSQPSSFFGDMGYIDCTNGKHVLTPDPWPASLSDIDPTKAPGIDSSDGVLVLNPDAVPNDALSVTSLKARF